MKIYSYSGCGSCKKALKWLDSNKLTYELIDIISTPPKKELIIEAINQFGSRKPLFNTSGASYRKLGSSFVKKLILNQYHSQSYSYCFQKLINNR